MVVTAFGKCGCDVSTFFNYFKRITNWHFYCLLLIKACLLVIFYSDIDNNKRVLNQLTYLWCLMARTLNDDDWCD